MTAARVTGCSDGPQARDGDDNAGKVREITALLADTGWKWKGCRTARQEFPEDGVTFAENAQGKALFYAGITSGRP